jgi:hypothetical protein
MCGRRAEQNAVAWLLENGGILVEAAGVETPLMLFGS